MPQWFSSDEQGPGFKSSYLQNFFQRTICSSFCSVPAHLVKEWSKTIHYPSSTALICLSIVSGQSNHELIICRTFDEDMGANDHDMEELREVGSSLLLLSVAVQTVFSPSRFSLNLDLFLDRQQILSPNGITVFVDISLYFKESCSFATTTNSEGKF